MAMAVKSILLTMYIIDYKCLISIALERCRRYKSNPVLWRSELDLGIYIRTLERRPRGIFLPSRQLRQIDRYRWDESHVERTS